MLLNIFLIILVTVYLLIRLHGQLSFDLLNILLVIFCFFSNKIYSFNFIELRMEKITQYCPVDSIFSNIQETAVSMGATCGAPRKFQSRTRPRHNFKKVVCKRRTMFSSKCYMFQET